MDRLQVAEADLDALSQIVREQPGILLAALRLQVEGMNTVVRRINFPYLDTNFSLYSYIFDVKQAYSDT